MALQCFALLHINKRNKTLQDHWTEQCKDQKITNGLSLTLNYKSSLYDVDIEPKYLISNLVSNLKLPNLKPIIT